MENLILDLMSTHQTAMALNKLFESEITAKNFAEIQVLFAKATQDGLYVIPSNHYSSGYVCVSRLEGEQQAVEDILTPEAQEKVREILDPS